MHDAACKMKQQAHQKMETFKYIELQHGISKQDMWQSNAKTKDG